MGASRRIAASLTRSGICDLLYVHMYQPLFEQWIYRHCETFSDFLHFYHVDSMLAIPKSSCLTCTDLLPYCTLRLCGPRRRRDNYDFFFAASALFSAIVLTVV